MYLNILKKLFPFSKKKEIIVAIIDDDHIFRRAVKKLFERFDVTRFKHYSNCESFKQAWNLRKEGYYSILILDHFLPDMTGLELLKEIDFDPKRTKVIYLTDMEDLSLTKQVMDQGVYNFIPKDRNVLKSLEQNMRTMLA